VESVRKLLQAVEVKDWQIVYLGAGIDAFSEMKQAFATHRGSSVHYARSRAGVAEMSLGLSDAVARYRASGQAVAEDLDVDGSGRRVKRSSHGPGGRQTDNGADPMSRLKRSTGMRQQRSSPGRAPVVISADGLHSCGSPPRERPPSADHLPVDRC